MKQASRVVHRAAWARSIGVSILAAVFVFPLVAPVAAAPPAHPGTVIIPEDKRPPGLNKPIRQPGQGRGKVHSQNKPVKPDQGVSRLAVVDIPAFSSSQTIRPLVLLLSFSDNAFSGTNAANYPAFLFSDTPGQLDNTFADYYREVSGGNLLIKDADAGSVVQVDMVQTYAYYVNGQSGFNPVPGYPQNARGMVVDALTLADSVNSVDFSAYDNDGPDGLSRADGSLDDDGIVDAFMVVHAGPAAEYLTPPESNDHIVSHYNSFPSGQEWTGDEVKVIDYAVVPEIDPPGRTTAEGSLVQTLGTIAHEFGHVLGLPDLYDTDLSTYGLGHYGLMSYGIYGMRTFDDTWAPTESSWHRPGYPSAWSRVYLGWVDPIAVHADTMVPIWRATDAPSTVLNYPQIARIWKSTCWPNLTTPNPCVPEEYFLFEHRQSAQGTYDEGFNFDNEGAVLIYHIDESILFPGGDLNYTPNNGIPKGVDLEEADTGSVGGTSDLDAKRNFGDFLDYPIAHPPGPQGDFYRQGLDDFSKGGDTDPSSDDNSGNATGIIVFNGFSPISSEASADYIMTVDFITPTFFGGNTVGYKGTDRAGPFTIAGGTFDDGGLDPWVQAGRNVDLNLTIKHSGMPNTAKTVTGALEPDPQNFNVSNGTVNYGNLAPLASSVGSGPFTVQFNYSSVIFTWVPATVSMADANNNFSQATFYLPLINHPPVAYNQTVNTNEDTPLPITLTADDADGDPLAWAVDSSPRAGTLSGTAPNLTYTPDPGYFGTDSFIFHVSDPALSSSPATVDITVNAVNDAPVAVDDFYSTDENTDLPIAAPGVLANDTDPEGDGLTAVLDSDPVHGSVALSTDGGFVYTPMPGYFGTDTFTYAASDGSAVSNTATVTITVNEINSPPVAVNDDYTMHWNTISTIPAPGVLSNDTDPDGDPLTAVLGSDPVHGALALSSDGGFVYTPPAGFTGDDTFTYLADDGSAVSGTATVTITVIPLTPPGGGGGGGCFIASASWGSEHWRTNRLRAFRDEYMLPSAHGRWLIEQYYEHSPGPAGWIQQHPWAQKMVAFILERVLWPLFL